MVEKHFPYLLDLKTLLESSLKLLFFQKLKKNLKFLYPFLTKHVPCFNNPRSFSGGIKFSSHTCPLPNHPDVKGPLMYRRSLSYWAPQFPPRPRSKATSPQDTPLASHFGTSALVDPVSSLFLPSLTHIL